MAHARYTPEGILTRHAAKRILRPYGKLLGVVVFEAWETWKTLGAAAPAVRLQLGRAARAMNVSDFIKDRIVDRFAQVRGCVVTSEYGRPVLGFGGGDLKIRLGKIDLDSIPSPRNERQLRIWHQTDAIMPTLPGMPSGTWAKCGYTLDPTETHIAGISVVCDLNGAHKWVLDLPVPFVKQATAAPTLLTTANVPPAKIASARQSADSQRRQASSG